LQAGSLLLPRLVLDRDAGSDGVSPVW